MMKNGYRLISLMVISAIFVVILNAASTHIVYGVLDRYTDEGDAVILLEDREEEWIVPADELPEASREGVWFQIGLDGESFNIISIDWRRTKEAERKSKELLDELRGR